jgi:hypothetical protein
MQNNSFQLTTSCHQLKVLKGLRKRKSILQGQSKALKKLRLGALKPSSQMMMRGSKDKILTIV